MSRPLTAASEALLELVWPWLPTGTDRVQMRARFATVESEARAPYATVATAALARQAAETALAEHAVGARMDGEWWQDHDRIAADRAAAVEALDRALEGLA